jgi:hypothetical protein
VRRKQAQHCRCGTRLAADHAALLCASCQRQSSADLTGAPAVPPDFWFTPRMRDALASRHIGRIIHAYRTHPYHGRVITQQAVAAWACCGQAHVSRTESGPLLHDLRRLAHWARVLRIPPRLLWFELPPPVPPGPPSGDDGRNAEAGEVSPTRRRDVFALSGLALAAPAIEGLERELDLMHLTLDRGTTSEERTTQLEKAATDLGVRAVIQNGPSLLNPTVRMLRSVRALLEERQSTRQQVRLVRVSAMLSTVVGELLFQTGSFAKAREWYLTASHAANDAGDRYLTDIALASQAQILTYSDDPRGVLTLLAPRLETNPRPSPAVAWLWGFTARAHASLGDAAGFRRSIETAHELMAHSPAELINPGVFSRQPANLLFYETTGAVALRQPQAAMSAADRFSMQPCGSTDQILVGLERASALAQSGEVPEACRIAIAALSESALYHDVGVRGYAARFDAEIRGIQSPETRDWREALAATHGRPPPAPAAVNDRSA